MRQIEAILFLGVVRQEIVAFAVGVISPTVFVDISVD
jgi:hypothetical protein